MSASRAQQILSEIGDDRGGGSVSLPERLCVACACALPVSGVALALMTDAGHQGVIGSTDGLARKMEDLQFTLGEGPCVDASTSGRPVLQPDLATTAAERWPGFGPEVLAAGAAAIFALPLQVGLVRLGVLDLYRDTAGALDDEQLGEALAFADAAILVLLHLQSQMEGGQGLNPQLSEPLDGKPQVHQATGMIAIQAAVGMTEALLLMRSAAFSAERTVLEVAHDVVGRRLRFSPEGDHHE